MGKYSADRAWADQWIPTFKQIIGPHLLRTSSFEEDVKYAADLIVLTAEDKKIACRVRREGYAKTYPNQFTIRSHRDNGAKTELEKIREGWGNWMFYGHESGKTIHPWWIIDLKSYRSHISHDGWKKEERREIIWGEKPNKDGTHFVWFDIKSFPEHPALLVAQSTPEPEYSEVVPW